MTVAAPVLAAVLLLAAGARGEEGQVGIQRLAGAESCGPVTIIATPAGASGTALRWTDAANVDLSAAEEWSITAESKGCWAPVLHVRRGAAGVVLPLWPEATLSGRLVVPKGAKMPLSMAVQVESPSVPRSRFECPVVAGRFRCAIPATGLDVRLAATEFVPRYFFGVDRPDLGEVVLARGGSVAGTIRFDGHGPPLSEIVLELRPESPPLLQEGWSSEEKRLASRAMTSRANERGFFQFAQVEPGQYAIAARPEGWSRVRQAGVQVKDGQETTLAQPLLVEPLAEVDVLIQPPLDPYGKPWQVSLREMVPLSTMSTPIVETEASMSGTWSAAGIDGGFHRIDVLDHRGSKFASSVVDVSPRMAPVTITMSAVLLRGTIRVGDEPLRARLAFRNGKGTTIAMRSDGEGRFSGGLPQDGAWDVDVAIGRPPRFQRRQVRVRAENGVADLDIRLPDTRVTGKVVGEDGSPVTAFVRIWSEQRTFLGSTSTDEHGAFEVPGIEPGAVYLEAESQASPDARSGFVPLAIGDAPTEDLTVVLRAAARLRGRLVTAAGLPVAGAIVRYLLPDRPGQYKEEVSGPNGTFTIAVSPGTPAIDVAILPPALPVRIGRFPVNDRASGTTDIVLGRASGILEIEMDHPTPSGPGSRLFIGHDGAIHHVASLSYPPNWTSMPRGFHRWGRSLEIEAGEYTICGDRTAADRCVRRTIAAGSVERVDGRALLR